MHTITAFLALVFCAVAAAAKPPVEIVTATYFGTAADDDLQGVGPAADGSLYVVGNTGQGAADLPGGVAARTLGNPAVEPKCGCGFVAHLSADGTKVLEYAQFAPGIVLLTTVQVNATGVYVGGYASEALEPLLKNVPGLMKTYPLTREVEELKANQAAGKKDSIGGRPGLGRYGAPCLLRLSADLKNLECGTYLEGWQQVWDKVRYSNFRGPMLGGYHEFYWQPTSLGLLKGGDVVVCHDGGYMRLHTDEDKKIAGDNAKLYDALTFYDVCDHLSRLSADLSKRAWHQPIYTPGTNPEVAKEARNGWPLAHYGNPRTMRMRLDGEGSIYLCGWSASATSKEPWWAPYLWKVDSATGQPVWKAYEHDPMGGRDHRMNGNVADTATTSLAIDKDGNVLASLLADGGNTMMSESPSGNGAKFEGQIKGGGFAVKLNHWWGGVQRFDAKTCKGMGGAQVGPWGWVSDLTSLPNGGVLAVGRFNDKWTFTDDAWTKELPVENPNAFLRIYSPQFDMVFSTCVPGIVPFELTPIGKNRYALVGRADAPVALTSENAPWPKGPGKADGYLMILEWKEP